MPFMDDRQNHSTELEANTHPSQMPGDVSQYSPVEQLPFPSGVSTVQAPNPSTGVANIMSTPPSTNPLPGGQTDALNSMSGTTTSTTHRQPVVIRASMKKKATKTDELSPAIQPAPKKRRMAVNLAITSLLVFILLGTLLAVSPLSSEGRGGFNFSNPLISGVNLGGKNSSSSIAQQAATATAVTKDGYDPGTNNGSNTYLPVPIGANDGGLGRFYYGQCTYWANMRYHQLTGYWVPWLGNADQWVAGAYASGWMVSQTPHYPSIVVLMPGVQGASYGYGHVAIAESPGANGGVVTSDWNWAGNWANTTYVTFYPGGGVYFVWHP